MNDTVEQKPPYSQLMIVNWKWSGFTHVNADNLSQEKKAEYLADIASGEGVFFKEYIVEESDNCPNARFVAVSIYHDPKDDFTTALFDALLTRYEQLSDQVMLFMHRSNNYNDQDVNRLLNRPDNKLKKCFLFADGRDYLYYKTQKTGFLDDIGGFFVGRDRETEEWIETFDEDKAQIKQPFFDRVWAYYTTEFESKVLHFKEELMDCWLPLLLNDSKDLYTKEALITSMKNASGRALIPRAHSFLGLIQAQKARWDSLKYEEQEREQTAIDALVALEKKDRQSYDFDDCIVNLTQEKNAQKSLVPEIYEETRGLHSQIVLGEPHEKITREQIQALADKLNALVKAIPGEID